jgi:hypothetical protein
MTLCWGWGFNLNASMVAVTVYPIMRGRNKAFVFKVSQLL